MFSLETTNSNFIVIIFYLTGLELTIYLPHSRGAYTTGLFMIRYLIFNQWDMEFLELFPDIFEEKRIRDMGYQAYRDLFLYTIPYNTISFISSRKESNNYNTSIDLVSF